ncbi:helix-turn-helix domain-containing protein [Actinomadura luteofluorescens]|uniref:helix-turn-helix domain-containing protein n=1 Tax=Actinomadura luteofluorescens TaxID=46163 RepID=UPI003D9051FF
MKSETRTLTPEEVLALPVAVDIVTAGRCFGISRTTAHRLAKDGEFPCQVLRLGVQYRVTRAELLRVLGIETAPVVLEESA